MRIEIKAAFLSAGISLCVLGLTLGLAPMLQSSELISKREPPAKVSNDALAGGSTAQIKAGEDLFARNCAHCHGDDARGDEGPSLYNLVMSDARIAKRIREGIKGEMPRFEAKLNDPQVAQIIAYLRALKD